MTNSKLEIINFSDEKTFIEKSVQCIAKICKAKKGIIRIALSGGTTPQKIYKTLARKKDVPFQRIELYIVDERFVPLNHPDSNYRMIFENLIKPVQKKLRAFHFFDTNLPIKKCLDKYMDELKNVRFDLVILGIGPDGHTASLFPQSKALAEKKKLVIHTKTNHFAVKNRLTVTFPVILGSKKILMLLKGPEKEKILHELTSGQKNFHDFPAKKLLDHKNVTIHYSLSS